MDENNADALKAAIDGLFQDVTAAAAREVNRISAGVSKATPPIAEKNAGSIVLEAIGWHFMTMFISASESIMVAARDRGEDVDIAHKKIRAYADDLSAFMVERLERARSRVSSASPDGQSGNGNQR